MIDYCLLNVEYKEHYTSSIPYQELGDHLDDAAGKINLEIYESGKTNNVEDTWNMEVDSDLDLYDFEDAEIYSDDEIAVYLLSNVPSSQSFDMHYTDSAEEYIDGYAGSGSLLVVNYKNRSNADLLAYIEQKVPANTLAAVIVVGDVAETIIYE